MLVWLFIGNDHVKEEKASRGLKGGNIKDIDIELDTELATM